MQVTLKHNQVFLSNQLVIPIQDIQVYYQALKFSSLAIPQQIDIRNVKIYGDDYIHEIYTKSNISYPHLMMLHGFGGTSLTYVRTFKQLSKYYQVHALDTFGVGYSSLGNFDQNFTHQQTIDYYISAIQEWRKALGIESVEIVGHSFGGYLGACYARKYPHRVRRLILLSPAGFNTRSTQNHNLTFKERIFYCIAQKIYNRNIKPTTIMRNFFLGNKFMERVLSGRLKLEGEQKQIWKKYFLNVAKKADSSEVGFYRIFEWPLRPQETILDMIKTRQIKLNVEVYFGGNMDWVHSRSQIDKIIHEFPENNIIYRRIEDAGHQVIFDSPDQVVELIVGNRLSSELQLVERQL